MIKVYVSGQVNKTNPKALLRSIDEMERVCKRILIAGAIPVAPSIWFLRMQQDPRLVKDVEWWACNVHASFMKECDIFCFTPTLVGLAGEMMRFERDAWKKAVPKGPMVPADSIMNFLCNRRVE